MAETETSDQAGTCIRQAALPLRPGDLRLVYAHDSCGYDPAATLVIGDCDLISLPSGLRVRRRDGTAERGLLDVVGDLISTADGRYRYQADQSFGAGTRWLGSGR